MWVCMWLLKKCGGGDMESSGVSQSFGYFAFIFEFSFEVHLCVKFESLSIIIVVIIPVGNDDGTS